MRTWEWIVLVVVVMLLCAGCSSTNLNAVRTEWTGGWVKASPADTTTPGKIEIGMGYGSFTMVPLARGQGAEFTAVTYELLSGHPLFAEQIIIYPVGQEAMLKLERSPKSLLKIPFIVDIKADPDPESLPALNVELVPAKK